jgi:hypothetical protein
VTERGGGGVKGMGREKKPTSLGRKRENMKMGESVMMRELRLCDKGRA